MEAATRRRRRQEHVALAAGWLAAVLQRAAKIPELDAVLNPEARPPRDLEFYLDELRVGMPRITQEEWAASVIASRQDT